MTVYVLDKNIVEDIHKSLRGLPSEGVALARKIDRKANMVSPLLAIVEGSLRRPQSTTELYDTLRRDSNALGKFYRKARTDKEFLQQQSAEMIITFGAHTREKSSSLIPLTRALQKLLERTYSVVDARGILQQIDELSQETVGRCGHPLFACAIACLYGHAGAKNVLKPRENPTEGDAYNAVTDVRMLIETAYIRRMWQKMDPRENVYLYTRDKHLNDFAKVINVVSNGSASIDDLNLELVNFSSTVTDPRLFPNLRNNPKEMERVFSYLRDSNREPTLSV
ncbi:MAG: hypothetical protein P8014_05300 [Acidihalobacter sp.]|uniref:hypothetical protein n=1 Tax=Acidihalobacter sp. TaxID=1872108 RepID=UPI00307F3E1F